MTNEIPDVPPIFKGCRIIWQCVDDDTPAGCTLLVAEVLGIGTTYILRDGQVIGRVEGITHGVSGHAGPGLKGGHLVGFGDFAEIAQRIADYQPTN